MTGCTGENSAQGSFIPHQSVAASEHLHRDEASELGSGHTSSDPSQTTVFDFGFHQTETAWTFKLQDE